MPKSSVPAKDTAISALITRPLSRILSTISARFWLFVGAKEFINTPLTFDWPARSEFVFYEPVSWPYELAFEFVEYLGPLPSEYAMYL
jgi:hypothetical protein